MVDNDKENVELNEKVNVKFKRLSELEEESKLLTFVEELDSHFEGGLPSCGIIEVSGPPGSGKTQFLLQLCVMCQIPELFGGANSAAIYIDTEGSFCKSRVREIAVHIQDHLLAVSRASGDTEAIEACQAINPDVALENIYVLRVFDKHELSAAAVALNVFCRRAERDGKRIGFVGIDSMAYPFRSCVDFIERHKILGAITNNLVTLIKEWNLVLIVSNHITIREGGGIHPALGDNWGHTPAIRLYMDLEYTDMEIKRTISVTKCSFKGEQCVPICISDQGVRQIHKKDGEGV